MTIISDEKKLVPINWAIYGSDHNAVDVTTEVDLLVNGEYVDGGRTGGLAIPRFEVTNDHLGVNPDKHVWKYLTVSYNYGGYDCCMTAKEKTTIDLRAVGLTINIIGAVFGSDKGSYDVTQKVKELLVSGVEPTKITATTTVFGDPCSQGTKVFGVKYEIGDKTYAKTCLEGGSVTLDDTHPS